MDFSEIFELATTVEFIRNSGTAVHEVKGKGWLVDMLNHFLYLSDVCGIEDEQVLENVKIWIPRLKRTYKKGQKIKKQDGNELSTDAERWLDLIYKELCARPCIEFQKGVLNQQALVSTSKGKPSNIFDRKVWKSLPKIARNDFSDAAKCLLVGASTPATMVALRGIEAVIRRYYSLKAKKAVGRKNLGSIIEELQRIPNANEKLLEYMDYIRSEKRNIAQHPTKIFNQREAERIFMEIVSATHDIYAEILRSKVKSRRKKEESF